MPGGSAVPLAQEWESTFFIIGLVMLALSLPLSGLQRMVTLATGGIIFLGTLIVVLITFHPSAASLAPVLQNGITVALGR